jgi:hypothetical protein
MRFLLFVQFGPVELRLRLETQTFALPSRLDLSLARTIPPAPRAKPRARASPAPDHRDLVS